MSFPSALLLFSRVLPLRFYLLIFFEREISDSADYQSLINHKWWNHCMHPLIKRYVAGMNATVMFAVSQNGRRCEPGGRGFTSSAVFGKHCRCLHPCHTSFCQQKNIESLISLSKKSANRISAAKRATTKAEQRDSSCFLAPRIWIDTKCLFTQEQQNQNNKIFYQMDVSCIMKDFISSFISLLVFR